tara:strand:- start:33 stop:533 length:501 start_codon:yes stop_codon:yes gene_type:complete
MGKKNLKSCIVNLITIVCFFCSTVLYSSIALAENNPPTDSPGQVITLGLGQCAPFPGTLFSTTAAVKLLVELKYTQEACNLEKDKLSLLHQTELKLKVDLKQVVIDSNKLKYEQLLKIKSGQISFLEKKISPPAWYESGEFWFSMGIVGGILITIGAAYGLSQASK